LKQHPRASIRGVLVRRRERDSVKPIERSINSERERERKGKRDREREWLSRASCSIIMMHA
jgi:hypothetical protein